jgi:acyl carrier protein
MITRATAYAELVQLVAEVFMIDTSKLTPRSTANDVPGWDSVSQVMLLMRIEDTFRIELDINRVSAAADLQALANLVYECRSSAWGLS